MVHHFTYYVISESVFVYLLFIILKRIARKGLTQGDKKERKENKPWYRLMAQQKMHALRRKHSSSQEVADGEQGSLPGKSTKQNNIGQSLEECGVSSHVCRNSDNRCAILTFLTLEPDGHWRIFALCPKHSNLLRSREQVKMDSLHPVSSPPISSFKQDHQQTQRMDPEAACFVKSCAARRFSGLNVQRHSQNMVLEKKAVESNEFSINPCQNSSTSSHFSSFLPSSSNATSSSDGPKIGKVMKRNSRKKARKKGKHKNFTNYAIAGSADLEVFSDECANVSLTSETCANNNEDLGDIPVSFATHPVESVSEFRVHTNDSESNAKATVDCSDAHKACPPNVEEADASETLVPSEDQSFSGEHPMYASEDRNQANDPGRPIFDVITDDTSCKGISCCDDTYSRDYSDMQDSLVLDSVGSNSDDSFDTGFDANKDSDNLKTFEPQSLKSTKGFIPRRNSFNVFLDSYHTEGPKCVGRGSGSSDMQVILRGKRVKQVNKVPRNSNTYRLKSVGNLYSRTGKENNHSVWQKVQRSDSNRCNPKETVNSSYSGSDISLKEAPLLRKKCYFTKSGILSKTEDKSQLRVKLPRKLKRKCSIGSKQEFNEYSSNKSHVMKFTSNAHAKINMQPNGKVDAPSWLNDIKTQGWDSRSCSQSFPQGGLCSDTVECIASKPIHSMKLCPNDSRPIGKVCNLDAKIRVNQGNSFPESSVSFSKSNLHEAQSQAYLPHLMGKEVPEPEKEVSHAENSKQDQSSESILQKWIPIRTKHSGSTSLCGPRSSSLASSDETAAEVWVSPVEEESGRNHVPSGNAKKVYTSQISRNESRSSLEDEAQVQKLHSQNTSYREQKAAADWLSDNMKNTDVSLLRTDSNKIAQAVNDACRVQLLSEAVQMASGSPIAEFERLLHSASPVICQSHSYGSCHTYSLDREDGASLTLCRPERPGISLGSLWKWYEKHGSYGLEVRGEDCRDAKILGSDGFSFHAYFVPYLSAVQLFRRSKGSGIGKSCGVPSSKCKTSEDSSNVGHLPIFSVLVPQPHSNQSSLLLSPVNQECRSEPSLASLKDDASFQSADTTDFNELELLFEYFEFEQPQQRRPLFEKIKELISGRSAPCKFYGDPTTLASVDLHHLHPISWYAVAWYPIYRIPDGDFRAAFLTYHSLGHLVHRSSTLDSSSVDPPIVSPVVGLQSYNAQNECWFKLKHSVQTADSQSLNPPAILSERLRTLEQTASLMARASVSKGNLTSLNRHPDFEFFVSRRR